jgi:hypothetical protein
MPAPVAPVANHSPIYGNYGYGVPYPQEEIVVSDTIVFKNKMRTIALNNTFSKTAQPKNSTARSTSEMSRINLKLSDNTSFDVLAAVVFKEDGQATFNEMEDVVTMGGRKYNLYTQSTPKDLIIDVQNGFSIDKIIPLGVLNNSDQAQISLTLSLQEANGIFASQNVYVYDTLTNQVHNLSQSFYTFTTQGAVNENRLYLVFTQTIPTFESRVSQEEAVRIVIKEGKLQIEATKQNIKSVEATDIYSFGKVFPFANKNNVNAKIYQENIPTNTHLIYIKVVLEDGTVISKKIKK